MLGAGVTGVTFDLYADGNDVIHRTFTSAAAAKSFFTNNAIDVGSLASGTLSGNTLTLRAVISVTTTSAGSGFYGDLIIGDPPGSAAAQSAAPRQRFIAAMASLGATAGETLHPGDAWAVHAPMIVRPRTMTA